MAAHRYWRWLFSSATSGNYALIGEAEMMTVVRGEDVTGTGTATADSSYTANTQPAKAFANDGVLYYGSSDSRCQCWESGNTAYPHWLQYDFGAGNEKEIVQYTLSSADSYLNEMPITWDFQYSDNGTDWTTVDTRENYSWNTSFIRHFIVGEKINVIITTKLLRSDVEDGGPLKIIEPVTRMNSPVSRRVRLCDQRSGRLVREQWSDPATGLVTFSDVREGPWLLYALDHTGEFEAVAISDRVATVDGLRP